jgi:hypothetical protein
MCWSAKIIQEAKSGDMPPLQYLALHWGAKLSKADVQTLSSWARILVEARQLWLGMAMLCGQGGV